MDKAVFTCALVSQKLNDKKVIDMEFEEKETQKPRLVLLLSTV